MFLALPVRETVKGHSGQSPVPTDRLWSKDVTLEANLTVAGVTEAHVDFPDSSLVARPTRPWTELVFKNGDQKSVGRTVLDQQLVLPEGNLAVVCLPVDNFLRQ